MQFQRKSIHSKHQTSTDEKTELLEICQRSRLQRITQTSAITHWIVQLALREFLLLPLDILANVSPVANKLANKQSKTSLFRSHHTALVVQLVSSLLISTATIFRDVLRQRMSNQLSRILQRVRPSRRRAQGLRRSRSYHNQGMASF